MAPATARRGAKLRQASPPASLSPSDPDTVSPLDARLAVPEEPVFLGSHFMTLANLMRRITASRFQRTYDLSLVDGWIILRLGAGAPMSLDALAFRSGLAKSQMSRGVSDLVERKLITRKRNEKHRTEIVIELTDQGRAIYDEMIRRAPHYNARLTDGFTAEERAKLTEFIGRLVENSRRNLADELTKDGGEI